MGNIPLPALNIRPPQQQASPIDQYAQLLQLKTAMQNAPLQQQALQQQVQAGQQENQLRAQQIKDQQATTASMQQWDGKDYDSLIPLVVKNGGSAQSVIGLKQHALDIKAKTAQIAKDDADSGSKNVETLIKKNDLIAGRMQSVADLPDDQFAGGLNQAVQDLTQQGLLDPQHAQQAAQLAQLPPAQAKFALKTMQKGLTAYSAQLDQAKTTAQTQEAQARVKEVAGKLDPNSPLYSPSPASVALGTAPGAAQIQQGEAKQAAIKAGAEAAARQPYEMSLARQRQALSQGDPNAAAQLLVSGDATLSELKARGATPDFIAKTLAAAHQLSGGKYNAQSADAQFSVAKSPANVAFFGSAKSLTDKGGTLDQLANAAKDIPGGLIPAFNSIADWEKAATGSGPIAKYASLALGVADDYSKVMGGGQGSDSSRAQALQLVGAKMSPQQRAASIEGIRGAVESQTNSRIGNNGVLQRMYGGDGAAPKSGRTQAPPGTQTFTDNGTTYHIPAGMVAEFKKDHPNAR